MRHHGQTPDPKRFGFSDFNVERCRAGKPNLLGFFAFCDRTPHDSKWRKWASVEENRDTVCNCVIDGGEFAD
jgi:hypothetical protein